MFPGSPAPLPPSTRLEQVLRLLPARATAGLWAQRTDRSRAPYPLQAPGGRGLLVASDLGWLLQRADRIAVRDDRGPALLTAAQLLRCRVLEIVLGTPYLPPPALLRELFPGVREGSGTLAVPIGLGSPEEALALCATHRIPVRSSRVAYAAPSR